MAKAIYIPTLFRARIVRAEAKRSTKHRRSAGVGLFVVSEGLAPSIGGFPRSTECRLWTPQLTAIVPRSRP
jgi:hypothetical protein